MVQVNVLLPTGSIVSPEVEPATDTVDAVTHKIHYLAREPKPHPSQVVLHFNGQRLERRLTLAFYKVGKDDQLQLQLIPPTTVVRLDVGGTLIKTTLDVLLADTGSLLYLMFEPMTQGGEPVNAAAARSNAGAPPSEGIPHQQYSGRPGPLPCEAGVYFIDSNPMSFGVILDHLRSLSRDPGGANFVLPSSDEDRQRVAKESEFYVLPGLVTLCTDSWSNKRVTHAEFLQMTKGGRDAQGLVLPFTDLRGVRLAHVNCSKSDFTGCDLSGVDLRGTNLSGAQLKGAILRGANLEGANLSGATLKDADLTQARLSKANLSRSDLTGAVLIFCISFPNSLDLYNKIEFFLCNKMHKIDRCSRGVRWTEPASHTL